MLVVDESNKRVTHFMSHKDMQILPIFNTKLKRDFFSNSDYERVGGAKDEIDSDW